MLWLLVVAAVVSCVSSRTVFGGSCSLDPRQDPKDTKKYSVDLPVNCSEGSIGWDWPRGELYVYLLLPSKDYSLCIVDSSVTLIGALYELTGGVKKQLPLPTRDHDVCTKSVNSETEILVVASTTQYYYTWVDYKIVLATTN